MKKVNFFTFFKLSSSDSNGACTWDKNFFQYLGHHLPPIPSTITRIKILILCTTLLCSMQHILIKKTQNHILTFSQQKTSNECYHSNQSPILNLAQAFAWNNSIFCWWATQSNGDRYVLCVSGSVLCSIQTLQTLTCFDNITSTIAFRQLVVHMCVNKKFHGLVWKYLFITVPQGKYYNC